jgi:hypothetical protein
MEEKMKYLNLGKLRLVSCCVAVALSAVGTFAGSAAAYDYGSWRESARRCDPARDRRAILGMAGTFNVSFNFEEVESKVPGYVLRPPYMTSGTEVVKAIEDGPRHVVLQHVLVIEIAPGTYYPLKHWRQDWVFEDQDLLEFQGHLTWKHRRLDRREVRCTWSQAVSQVDDGPRYQSYGSWEHGRRQSSWTSNLTYRPLPRRELSQRDDYDVLLAINTHVVHAGGWDHVEDNLKWVLGGGFAWAREEGLNRYQRVSIAAEQVGLEYLERTGAFWEDVRAEWESLLGLRGIVRVLDAIEGVAPYDILFPLADQLATAQPALRRAEIHEVLAPYVERVGRDGGSRPAGGGGY